MADTSNQQDMGEQQPQEGGGESTSTSKQHTNKLENPESIPTAGDKQIGEDHKGESKMLGDNARSESVAASGNADGEFLLPLPLPLSSIRFASLCYAVLCYAMLCYA